MTDIIDIRDRKKRTVPLPELSLELLKEAPSGWETAMVYPLPSNPSSELLEAARKNVIDFLDINSQRIATTETEISETLREGCEKLIEIAILLRKLMPEPGPSPDDGLPF